MFSTLNQTGELLPASQTCFQQNYQDTVLKNYKLDKVDKLNTVVIKTKITS